jgi:beta-glucosidase
MGPAIAELLYGDVSPSGKLTATFPKSEADLPTAGSPAQYPGIFASTGTTTPPSPRNGEIRQVSYSEGLKVGYRWYESQGITPLFAFGYGLSYTSFDYGPGLATPLVTRADRPIHVHFLLRNTGRRTGTEVAQVYVTLPRSAGEPSKRLVGWQRVTLGPHRSQIVDVTVDPTSAAHPLSYWNESAAAWTTPSGIYTFSVGSSSANIAFRAPVLVLSR